jgi:hypothetical protein
VQRCTVQNISQSGAQILAAHPRAISKTFTLPFSQANRSGKRCHVVWRTGAKLRVKFGE